jgi:AcrR family transcriptional regulator
MKKATRVTQKRLPRAERREIVLEIAKQHFAQFGFRGANLEDIASASGVTKPVLYDHFASKEGLFLAVLDGIRNELLSVGQHAIASDATNEKRIKTAIRQFFEYAEQHPTSMQVLLSVAQGEGVLERAVNEIQEEVTTALATLFRGLIHKRLSKRQEDQLLLQIEFIKQGMHALARWQIGKPGVSTAQLTETVMRVAWTGLSSTFN